MTAGRRTGQPLGFLVAMIALWLIARIAGHYWFTKPPEAGASSTRVPESVQPIAGPASRTSHQGNVAVDELLLKTLNYRDIRPRPDPWDSHDVMPPNASQSVDPELLFPLLPATNANQSAGPEPGLTAEPLTIQSRYGTDRWSLTGWVFGRSGPATAALAGPGQYGGSQAGLLLRHRINRNSAILYARGTRAIEANDPVLAIGGALRPLAGLPLEIGVERRIALTSRGRDGMAALAVMGGEVPMDDATRLRGFGQAGLVGLQRRDRFFDLQLGALRRVTPPARRSVSIGLGLWAGGQDSERASGQGEYWLWRADLGPSAEIAFPLGTKQARLAVDWRQRVAGDALPGSGPAVTLAADF